MHRASIALSLVLFAVAASCASAFSPLPADRTNIVVGTTAASKFKSPVSTPQRHGILTARVSGDGAEKKIGEDGGGSATLAVAVAGGGGGAGVSTSNAVAGASFQKATTGGTIQVDGGGAFDPAGAAEEATKKTRAQVVTSTATKSIVRSFPGTWWTAGLPRWMHVVRRRMITKEDWMHLHAASGAVRKIRLDKDSQIHRSVHQQRVFVASIPAPAPLLPSRTPDQAYHSCEVVGFCLVAGVICLGSRVCRYTRSPRRSDRGVTHRKKFSVKQEILERHQPISIPHSDTYLAHGPAPRLKLAETVTNNPFFGCVCSSIRM